MVETGTYLYAISQDSADIAEPGVTGTTVRPLHTAGLVAHVSTVCLDMFGEEPLRRNLEQLGWLEETARTHDRVIRAIAGQTTTAPVRLATIYRSDEQLQRALADSRAVVVDVLDYLAGRSEWGVKAYVRRDTGEAEPARTGGGGGVGVGDGGQPGTAYLNRRRRGMRAREDAIRRATALGDDIHAHVAKVAVSARRHPAQHPQLSGRDDWMILNGAYLIADDRTAELRTRLAALEGKGAEIELTGPWVPYSFAEVRLVPPGEETPT